MLPLLLLLTIWFLRKINFVCWAKLAQIRVFFLQKIKRRLVFWTFQTFYWRFSWASRTVASCWNIRVNLGNYDTQTSCFTFFVRVCWRSTQIWLPFPLGRLPTHGTILAIRVIMNWHYVPVFTRTWCQILREVDSAIDRGCIFRMLVNRYWLLGRQNLLAIYLFPWCSNFYIFVLFNFYIHFLDFHQVLRMRSRLLAHVTIEHLKFTFCLFAILSQNLHGFIENYLVTTF